MKVIIAIFICFILPISVLIKPIIEAKKKNKTTFSVNKKGIKEFVLDNKFEIILFFILIIGSAVRVIRHRQNAKFFKC